MWVKSGGYMMIKQVNARVDLTEGSILKKLIIFTIPMFLGNLFQQFYNLTDALIVGNFASNEAFAAISSTGSFIFLLVGFFNGIAMGASVVISKYVGAKDVNNIKKSIHTVFAFGLVASIMATIIGLIITPYILTWMDTPKSVFPKSLTYLSIYFGGVSTVIIYNVCMGIMRATGDSKHPLYYLIISSIINVVLDLLFVAVFNFGIAGAAIATIIAQGISCYLCIKRLVKLEDETRLILKEVKFHKGIINETLIIGLPTGFQNSIISIGNIVIQTNINSFGPNAMSGYGAYARIEGFAFLPISCMSMALTTFVSQNLGARQYQRAKRGALLGTLLSVTLAELIGLTIMFNSQSLLNLFIDKEDAIAFGIIHANISSLFFFLLAFSHCASGILRGCGKSLIPMFTMLAFWCVIRVTYVTITIQYFPVFQTISWAYPLTWSLSSLVFIIVLLSTDWVHGLEKRMKTV